MSAAGKTESWRRRLVSKSFEMNSFGDSCMKLTFWFNITGDGIMTVRLEKDGRQIREATLEGTIISLLLFGLLF